MCEREKRTDSGIKRIDGDGASANEDLIGLEIRDVDDGPELQNLGPAEARQHDGSAGGDDVAEPNLGVVGLRDWESDAS